MSYVASAQEGLLPPYPAQIAPGSSTGAYNYGVAVPTYYETGTGSLPILPPRLRNAKQDRGVGPAQGVGCSPRCTIAGRRVLTDDPSNGIDGQLTKIHRRRNSRSPGRLPRVEGTTENRFIKGPEKPPIREIDTIYGGPYIGGQSRNAQKNYAKEAEGKLEMNWLINSRPSSSCKVDPISFTEEDMKGVHYPHCDALVVRAVVARNGLGRMLVDNGSSVNVIFLSTYEQMNIDVPLEPSTEPLYGFTGDCVTPKGIIRLAVTMGEEPLAAHTFMEFLVVDRRSAYHGVLGRPALKEL
ncbi:Uncharacterized protein Adt_15735 [Abeliophyllum distichum]|uniref:Uncharacterized protein n=1 Tax=Abeliophyllum distichum TaxID=126358 RepID=A0ABD1U3Z3_9LAMI